MKVTLITPSSLEQYLLDQKRCHEGVWGAMCDADGSLALLTQDEFAENELGNEFEAQARLLIRHSSYPEYAAAKGKVSNLAIDQSGDKRGQRKMGGQRISIKSIDPQEEDKIIVPAIAMHLIADTANLSYGGRQATAGSDYLIKLLTDNKQLRQLIEAFAEDHTLYAPKVTKVLEA